MQDAVATHANFNIKNRYLQKKQYNMRINKCYQILTNRRPLLFVVRRMQRNFVQYILAAISESGIEIRDGNPG